MKVNHTYRINEIFYSIQGEGEYTGQPMVFVRFSGCNLNCSFCDTRHQSFEMMDAEAILKRIRSARKGGFLDYMIDVPICLTGGEPMLQLDEDLVSSLVHMTRLHVETNGTIWNRKVLDRISHLTVSPKRPISDISVVTGPSNHVVPNGPLEAQRLIKDAVFNSGIVCELKIVWTDRQETMLQIQEWGDSIPWLRRSIQPCYLPDGSVVDKKGFLNFILHNPDWCLSCQTQKYLNFQ